MLQMMQMLQQMQQMQTQMSESLQLIPQMMQLQQQQQDTLTRMAQDLAPLKAAWGPLRLWSECDHELAIPGNRHGCATMNLNSWPAHMSISLA